MDVFLAVRFVCLSVVFVQYVRLRSLNWPLRTHPAGWSNNRVRTPGGSLPF